MSFRRRLSLFFVIIVVVPMAAVALVLFSLTADSENGKADARMAAGMQAALTLYGDAQRRAERELRAVIRDGPLQRALEDRDFAATRARLQVLRGRNRKIRTIAFYGSNGRLRARVGSSRSVAYATAAPTTGSGRRIGALAVSVLGAERFAREASRFTGFATRVTLDGRELASTLPGRPGPTMKSGDVELGGREYRVRVQGVEGAPVPIRLGIFAEAEEVTSSISESRLLIGAILLAFLVLSLASSVFVVRALHQQIEQFLGAARRLARGDFGHPVPIEGDDEFAELGREFNSMSRQLEVKISEVEGKRHELEASMRRVGEAFAKGLDRVGLVELAVETAVQACAADAGRATPLDRRRMAGAEVGDLAGPVGEALSAAEREALAQDGAGADPSAVSRASTGHAHALATVIPASVGADEEAHQVGVLAIARSSGPFDASDEDLLGYLASQAAISMENADLHETIQQQAVTDELTGLHNLRSFNEILDGELERSRRFETDVGLTLLDLDDFKAINDTYGHLQGDHVLRAVATVLRDSSRDIDEPARYGGEEMAVILPGTDGAGARLLAERMREAIEALEIEHLGGGRPLRVTASFGVAAAPSNGEDRGSLVAAADAALYRAKREGKNRVVRARRRPLKQS